MENSIDPEFLKATNLFIQGHIDDSISIYSNLLSKLATYNLFINRAIAYISKNDIENSIKDCNSAIAIDSSKYEGHLYRGMSYFYSGKMDEALIDFNNAINVNAPKNIIDKWIIKCQREVENRKKKEEKNKTKINESQQEILQKHHIYSSTGKLAYSWYQTDKTVGIILNFKVKDREQLKYKVDEEKIDISFPLDDNKEYNLSLNLWEKINHEKSKVLPTLECIEIVLEKLKTNVTWLHLCKEDPKEKQETEDKATIYPSSAFTKKDWGKIEKELEEEIREDQEKYGDARKGLIEALYNNSNEEQRRALAKSVEGSKGCYMYFFF